MIRTILIDDEPSAVSVLSTLLKSIAGRMWKYWLFPTPRRRKGPDRTTASRPCFPRYRNAGNDRRRSRSQFSIPGFRVVFVTAYDAYAVEAFRLSAVDYLLKPVGSEDVIKVIQKIRHDVRNELGRLSIQLQNLDKLLNNHSGNTDQKIGIAMSDKIVFVNFSEIIYCEANGSYTYVFNRWPETGIVKGTG